jgi:uncharacterized protein
MEIVIGYLLAILVGISIGLIGAGGSILTIPILVYLLGVEAAITAPAYSLFIVGCVSVIGVIIKQKNKEVNFKLAFLFGIPTIISIVLTRHFIIPAIPTHLFTIGTIEITNRILVMSIFAITMLLSAIFMIKNRPNIDPIKLNKKNYVLNFSGGLSIGFLSGLVGAGGGFVIIPALIKSGNLSIKTAVGTSLAIIAMNSFFGFIGSVKSISINWGILIPFTLLAMIGIFIGHKLSSKINGSNLKKGFGWFVLLMGIFIIIKEIIIN